MSLWLALVLAGAQAAAPAAPAAPPSPMAALITSERAADPAPAPGLAAMAEDTPDKAVPATQDPKAAPQQKVEKLRKVVVRAIRNCPEAKTPEEIVVCSKDRGIAEAYRLPKLDPRYGKPEPAIALTGSVGGGQGLGSGNCSAAGSAGQLGCALGEANAWGAERKAAGKKWGQKN